jgi:hypothetical protein
MGDRSLIPPAHEFFGRSSRPWTHGRIVGYYRGPERKTAGRVRGTRLCRLTALANLTKEGLRFADWLPFVIEGEVPSIAGAKFALRQTVGIPRTTKVGDFLEQ